ncbi:hypothetical protein JCM8097_008149 [Rhodosporidiobolus ruineniae]
MLVPGSMLDGEGLNQTTVCAAFVVGANDLDTADKAAFVEQLEGATERVVSKWKLLQGLPKKLETGQWGVDVPDKPPTNRKRHGFTTDTLPQPYHLAVGASSPLPALSAASSGYFPKPKSSLFRSPTAPVSNNDHVKKRLPLLNIHVTVLADAFAVGVSFPHGIFDGGGIGMIIQALDAELHGKPWPFDIPPLFSVEEGNPMTRALESLVQDPAVEARDDLLLHPWTGWGGWPSVQTLRFVLNVLLEQLWWKRESRYFFLRREAVETMVKRVKEEVKAKTGGAEYVSEADVVGGWLIQSAHLDETTGETASILLMTPRPLLAEYTAKAGLPPYPFAQYPFNTWPEWPSFIRRFLPGGRDPPRTRWCISNQCALNLTALRFPSPRKVDEGKDLPLLAFHTINIMPFELVNTWILQSLPEGITITGFLRKSRWASFEKAVAMLEEDAK